MALTAPGMATATIAMLLAAMGAGCGEGDDGRPSATRVAVAAEDYRFDAPATIKGGLVELDFSNRGKEPHFAGLAKVASGASFDDAKAALLAPPSPEPPPAPPPFEDFGGVPTTDPGVAEKMTVALPPGTYVFYCLIASPDGTPHAAKGMITKLTVTPGPRRPLPKATATVVATDFAFDEMPALEAGTAVVGLRNQGGQTHEINLVELAPGRTVDEVVAWYRRPSGPPPMRSLAGVALKPGSEGTTTLRLRTGATYAFICAIPDTRGDFAPHVAKGMFTKAFTVS